MADKNLRQENILSIIEARDPRSPELTLLTFNRYDLLDEHIDLINV